MFDSMKRLWQDDSAQDIAEYALLLAVILVIVISVVTAVGTNANTIFSKAADKLNTAGTSAP
jgi:Flp pilus assembly pilin Flp